MTGCPASKKCFVPCLLEEELQHLHVHMLNIIADAPCQNLFFHVLHIPLYCHEFLDLLDRCLYTEYPGFFIYMHSNVSNPRITLYNICKGP
jgi:hypothetical protein